MQIKLKKPVEFEGYTYKVLDIDFDELTGADILEASTNAQLLAKERGIFYNPMDEVNSIYFVAVAAKAAKVPPDLLLALKGSDFSRVVMYAKNELMGETLPSEDSSSV